MKDTNKYAVRIWFYRQYAGLSQQELANATGLSQGTIAKLETGARKLTIDEAIAITEALHVSLDVFFKEQITVTI